MTINVTISRGDDAYPDEAMKVATVSVDSEGNKTTVNPAEVVAKETSRTFVIYDGQELRVYEAQDI